MTDSTRDFFVTLAKVLIRCWLLGTALLLLSLVVFMVGFQVMRTVNHPEDGLVWEWELPTPAISGEKIVASEADRDASHRHRQPNRRRPVHSRFLIPAQRMTPGRPSGARTRELQESLRGIVHRGVVNALGGVLQNSGDESLSLGKMNELTVPVQPKSASLSRMSEFERHGQAGAPCAASFGLRLSAFGGHPGLVRAFHPGNRYPTMP